MNADAKIHRESISLWHRDRSLSPHDLLCPRHTCGPLTGRSPPPPGASCPSPCRRPCWPGTSCRWGLAGCWAGSAPASSAGPSWSSHWSGTSSSAGTECSHHLRPRGCDGVGRWWLLWEDWHLSEGGGGGPPRKGNRWLLGSRHHWLHRPSMEIYHDLRRILHSINMSLAMGNRICQRMRILCLANKLSNSNFSKWKWMPVV